MEDSYTGDLLLLFTVENRLKDENETLVSTTCNLRGYSKQNLLALSNIDCPVMKNENPANTIE